MNPFKKLLWPFINSHRPAILGIILLGFINSCCTLLVPLSIGRYIDILFAVQTSKGRALSILGIHLPSDMAIFFIFFAALLLAKLLSGWAEKYWSSCYADRYVLNLRYQLFRHHYAVRNAGHPVSADALTAYSSEMKLQQQWLVKGVIGFIKDTLFLILSLYVLFGLQPILSGITLLFLPIFYWLHKLGNARLKPYFVQRRKRQASLFGFVTGQIMAQEMPNPETESRFRQKNSQWLEAGKPYHLYAGLQQALTPLMLYGMLGTLLYAMAWVPEAMNLNSGDTVTYILLLMMLFPALRNTLKLEKIWMQARVSAQKFLKFV